MCPTIQTVVFDFDGVVLDSARIKTEAFVAIYDDHPDLQNAIREYHLDNQGVSRFVKFRWIAANLIGQEISEEQSAELGNKFSDIVFSKVLEAEHIPGSREFLEFLLEKRIPAYVASGTPETELRQIVERRGLGHYFTGVFGTPKKKAEILRMVMDKVGIGPESVLMIGDASTDYEAANTVECEFLGIWSQEMSDYWKTQEARVDPDLTGVSNLYAWRSPQ